MLKSAEFVEAFKIFKDEFQRETTINFNSPKSISTQVMDLFKPSQSGVVDYNAINNSKEVEYLNNNVDALYEFILEYNDYAREYNISMKKSADSYISLLSNTNQLSNDNNKGIKETVQKLKKAYYGDGSSKGFSSKYKDKVARVTNQIREIRKPVS